MLNNVAVEAAIMVGPRKDLDIARRMASNESRQGLSAG
jgi:hypothetical protein